MDYLVFETETQAEAVEAQIFHVGALLAHSLGYFVEDGVIHGKKDGTSSTNTGVTTRWAIPKQRLDNKWVIPHPKHSDHAKANPDVMAQLETQLVGIPVETFDPSWFPEDGFSN